jgi:hypothetical protein
MHDEIGSRRVSTDWLIGRHFAPPWQQPQPDRALREPSRRLRRRLLQHIHKSRLDAARLAAPGRLFVLTPRWVSVVARLGST